jgi:hypothetical protein
MGIHFRGDGTNTCLFRPANNTVRGFSSVSHAWWSTAVGISAFVWESTVAKATIISSGNLVAGLPETCIAWEFFYAGDGKHLNAVLMGDVATGGSVRVGVSTVGVETRNRGMWINYDSERGTQDAALWLPSGVSATATVDDYPLAIKYTTGELVRFPGYPLSRAGQPASYTATGLTGQMFLDPHCALICHTANQWNKVSMPWVLRPTYGANVAMGSYNELQAIITATDGNNFAIAAPASTGAFAPIDGQILTVIIRNSSGGVLGTITWAAGYKMGGAFTKPADGYSRSIQFMYDTTGGSVWVEISRGAADVPN